MVDESLFDRLPSVFPLLDESTDFYEFVDAHQTEVETFKSDLDAIQKSLQVAHATGDELDRIGADFGRLGRRRGRSDSEYRQYLQSLVDAFRGRGRSKDVRFAVAAALAVDISTVSLVEDFDALEYEVVLTEWTSHSGANLEDIADLADPAAVELVGTTYKIDPEEAVSADAVIVGSDVTLDDEAKADDSVATTEASLPRDDRWDEDSWDFMTWIAIQELSRDVGTDETTTADTAAVDPDLTTVSDGEKSADTVGVDPNKTSVSDGETSADSVTTMTTIVAWDAGSWDSMDWSREQD